MARRAQRPQRTNDEIRRLILQYFYDRNSSARSARGKKGVAAKISVIKKELKELHGLRQQEVWSNLTYLISQGWVEEDSVEKQVPLPTGTLIPQSTAYYKITALGIDKIEGPGEFTVDKFKGIKIEATGQNIITVGDGNQVDAKFGPAAEELVELKRRLIGSTSLTDTQKLEVVADIDTIQSQLAKTAPTQSVIRAAWTAVKEVATGVGLGVDLQRVGELLGPLLGRY